MKTKLIVLSVLILSIINGCKKENDQPNHEPKILKLPANSAEVISISNSFGINLFTATAKDEEGNMMLSPLSASLALTMLLNGCDNNTHSQIQQMLNYKGMTQPEINAVYNSLVRQLLTADSEVKLIIANAIWYRNGFELKVPFLESMNSDFNAHIEGLDFNLPSAAATINNWASDNTNGKIPKVLDEISSDMVMLIMNALYFKGNWTYQFDKTKTSSKTFHLEDGSDTNVDMMQTKINVNVLFNESYRAIELNYGRTNYSMVVIVPDGNLGDFYSSFDQSKWESIAVSFDSQTSKSQMDVYLPKFKFSYEKFLNDQLKSMGMIDAFDNNLADLSKISDANLFVDFVKQNTFVDINEEGTEVAAVTTIGVGVTSIPNNAFDVDKPFVFVIRERTTNTILFIGKVINPNL